MDGCENIILYESLAKENSILVVVAIPWHKRNEDILSKAKLTIVTAWTIRNQITRTEDLTKINLWTLRNTGSLVGADHVQQDVAVKLAARRLEDNFLARDTMHSSVTLCKNNSSRVNRGLALHASLDKRRRRANRWDCLTLHVRAHQSTVCVVVFQEWNHRRSDRNQLLWRNIDKLHFTR